MKIKFLVLLLFGLQFSAHGMDEDHAIEQDSHMNKKKRIEEIEQELETLNKEDEERGKRRKQCMLDLMNDKKCAFYEETLKALQPKKSDFDLRTFQARNCLLKYLDNNSIIKSMILKLSNEYDYSIFDKQKQYGAQTRASELLTFFNEIVIKNSNYLLDIKTHDYNGNKHKFCKDEHEPNFKELSSRLIIIYKDWWRGGNEDLIEEVAKIEADYLEKARIKTVLYKKEIAVALFKLHNPEKQTK